MLRAMFHASKKAFNQHQGMRLPLIPGQPIYHPRVEEELRNNPYFSSPAELKEINVQIVERTLDILGCKKHSLFYINGSYRHALDVALINSVEKEDIVLLIGDTKWHRSLQKRLLFFCNGADIFPLPDNPTKEALNETFENLATQIEEKPYKIVMVPHAQNKNPQVLPINEVAKIANSANSFVLLDAHTTAGAIPIDQTNRFDVIVASSNWGFASSPGLGLLAISEELTADIEAQQRDLPPTLDLDYWQAISVALDKGKIPDSFEFVPSQLRALNTSLEIMTKNIEAYQELQAQNAFMMRILLTIFGFNLGITKGKSISEEKKDEKSSNDLEKDKKANETASEDKNQTDQEVGDQDDQQIDPKEHYQELTRPFQQHTLTPTYTTFYVPKSLEARELYDQLIKQRLIVRFLNETEGTFQIGHVGYLTNEHLFATAKAFYNALHQLKPDFVTTQTHKDLEELLLSFL